MFKHRGFPEYVPGTDHKVTIRRAGKTPTPLHARERYRDRKADMRRADAFVLHLLIERYGDAPFARGNLDAGQGLPFTDVLEIDDCASVNPGKSILRQ